MDFRFRANDNKSPATATSTSVRSFDQLLQDSLNAELLKQRMKDEIMIREIASRRMLEAEIRRELIIEQELAKRRVEGRTEGLLFDDQFSVRLLDQIRMNHNIVDPFRGLLTVPGSSSSPLPVCPVPNPQNEEPKPFDDKKNKLIVLPKPDPAKFEGKRKAEGEAAEVDTDQKTPTHWISSKKLAKEEFVCSMCNVQVTSEISFNAHLKGKKHMAKEGRSLQTQEPSPAEDLKEKLDNQKKDADKKSALKNKVHFKFWCKICEIGTPCMAIMVSHNNGKKHKARLLKLSQQSKLDDQKDEPNPL
ncbi:zinc finger protein 385B [Benincasa hispida]|uniref:zinc finger protein 385B n=1 Tax=Benincasa hispida TaxID=102211 RepID=UPI0018FFC1EA|nr:zinc finger protein 385B [Benincasa hispida]